jgi:hypothetical protein
MLRCGLDSTGSGLHPMAVCCEPRNQPLGSKKDGKCLEQAYCKKTNLNVKH